MHSQESIQLLQDSGIDFNKLERDGMEMEEFGELLTTSGLICNDHVTWLSFHRSVSSTLNVKTSDFCCKICNFYLSCLNLYCNFNTESMAFSGYDFGYVMRAITGVELPKTDTEFTELRKIVFPNIYDLKFLLKQAPREENIKGGLQEIADKMLVRLRCKSNN